MADRSNNSARGTVVVKKSRIGRPHSKSGCKTCKIRRIKCDEAKPYCFRCKSTGRKCDGYEQQTLNVHPSITHCSVINFQNPFLDFPGSRVESRFLCFFSNHTAPVISGIFDADFWTEILPRYSRDVPAIRHAMIAIAASHARVESMPELIEGIDKEEESHKFELQQYNKALRLLRAHLSEDGVTFEITLISCILFICLELLKGGIDQAILHLQAGISILESYRTSFEESRRLSSSEQQIRRKLRHILYRLRVQGALFGRMAIKVYDPVSKRIPDVLSNPFSCLDDARPSLDHLFSEISAFLHSCASSESVPPLAGARYTSIDSLTTTYLQLNTRLAKWSETFELFVAQTGSVTDPKFSNGCIVLRVLHILASIWLSAYMSSKVSLGLGLDSRTQDFSTLLELASSLSTKDQSHNDASTSFSQSSTKFVPSFGFDMGAIAPLYLVVLGCRDRQLRRRAISALHSCSPRIEGLWNANVVEFVAKRVVELEEVGLEEYVESASRDNSMPPEQDRIYDVKIKLYAGIRDQSKPDFDVAYLKMVKDSNTMVYVREKFVLGADMQYHRISEDVIHGKSLEWDMFALVL